MFEEHARKSNLRAFSVGDAFSDEVKERTADLIEKEFGQVDLIVYSLAVPSDRPQDRATYRSVLKPIGKPYSALSVNLDDPDHRETIEPATAEQTEETVKVMGARTGSCGSIFLTEETFLPKGQSPSPLLHRTEMAYPSTGKGRSGKRRKIWKDRRGAFQDPEGVCLGEQSAGDRIGGDSRRSAPMALLYAVMSEQGIHEQCTEQIWRLFTDRLYAGIPVPTDKEGRIRLDDWEMDPLIQAAVQRRWEMQREGKPLKGGNLALVRQEYDRIHGFGYKEIDYGADVDPRVV